MAAHFCRRLLAACTILFLAFALRAQDAQIYRPEIPRIAGFISNVPSVQPVSVIPPAEPILRLPGPEPITTAKIVHAAGIIFSGRVLSIAGGASSRYAPQASTTITFQVEHALRGALAGQTLTIHEWAALWNRGERYRVGERVFLFLYPVSKLGFTSPVGGVAGRIAVDSHERIVMTPQNFAIFAKDLAIYKKAPVPYANFAEAIARIAAQN
jgi:hypothetical protein